MVMRPEIGGPVEEQLEAIKDEHEYPNIQEAIRHALRQGGYDV